MTTFIDVIERTRNYLMTGQQDRTNILDLTIDSSTDTVQFRYELKSVVENAVISIDLEEMKVLSVSSTAAGSTATVVRGFSGSTAAAHTIGAIIRVSAQFTNFRIGQEINEELESLSSPLSGLFRIESTDFTFTPSQMGYSLNVPGLIDVWRVRYDVPGPSQEWPVFRRDSWYLDQDPDPTEFPDNVQLVLRKPAFPGHTVRVSYKSTFGGPLTTPAQDILTVTGLHTEAHNLLPLGAAISLTMGRDVKRSFMESQPEPRRSDEVGTSAGQLAMRPIIAKYQSDLDNEVNRLMQRYPEQM